MPGFINPLLAGPICTGFECTIFLGVILAAAMIPIMSVVFVVLLASYWIVRRHAPSGVVLAKIAGYTLLVSAPIAIIYYGIV